MTDPSQMSDAELMAALGVQPQVSPQRKSAPQADRGTRNANAGNLKASPWTQRQPGFVGQDAQGFAVFDSPQSGEAAQVNLLRTNYAGMSPAQVVNKYAPVGPENSQESVNNYIAYAARRAGIDPNAPIPEASLPAFAQAMREFETGQTQGGGQPQAQAQEPDLNSLSDEELMQLAGITPNAASQAVQGSSQDNPIDLTGKLYQDQVDALKQGAWVRAQNGETYQLPGDAFSDRARPSDQAQGGNVFVRRPNLEDRIGAFASAAAEQIPFLDESVAATTGLLSGQGYDAMRQAQSVNRDLLNQTNRDQRNAGGVAGFATGFALPGGAFVGRGVGLGGKTLRSLGVGTGYGALYGAGSAEDGLGNRAAGLASGAVIGGVTGGAAPAVGSAASAVSAPVVNFLGRGVNSLSGGRIAQRFAPEAMAGRELANALRDNGVTEEVFVEAMNRLQGSGVNPTLLDVLQEVAPNGKAARLIRGVAMHDDASQIATRYARETAEAVPALGQNLTRRLAPNAPSTPAMMDDIAYRIENALPPPQATPGSGGEAVSSALNSARDGAKRAVDQAYDHARSFEPGRAMIAPSEARTVQANVLDAVSDFDMRDVPRVGRVLEELGSTVSPSVRSLFEARSRLGNLRISNDPVEGNAAGRAVRAIDAEIDRLVETNAITGDVDAVNAWRAANSARADFGRRFEGGDLIDRLTAREHRGGGMTNTVAPEDASNFILGQGRGVRASGNSVRDLERVRGMAPEAFGSLRAEAGARLSRMQGERVAPDLETLRRQNPRLADLLMDSATADRINRAVAEVSRAQGDRGAVNMGQRLLNATPDEFAAVPTGDLLRGSSVNRMVDEIGSNPARALNQAAFNPNTRANLGHALGSDAAGYSDSMRYLGDRLRNSQFINSASGSKTAGASMDAASSIGFVSGLMSGGKTAVLDIIGKVAAGTRLSSADRQALMRMGVSEAEVLRAASDPVVIGYLVAPTARLEGQIAGQGSSR